MKDLRLFTEKSFAIRRDLVEAIGDLGVGHIGGSLSIADLLAVLYFGVMNVDPANPKMEGRDRLVVSKGHAGPAVYAALVERGYFARERLFTLNRLGTDLPSHCDMNRTPGVDMTTGSLGQGFSCAAGAAYGSKLRGDGATIYAVIGDGESQEGQIWEAAMFCANHALANLVAFTDYNRLQLDGSTDEVNCLDDLEAKWRSFNWNACSIDGHDHGAIYDAIASAKAQYERPSMIILNTKKGKGVSLVENAGAASHNMPFSKEQAAEALAELAAAEGAVKGWK